MNYYVRYVERCTPKSKTCKSKKEVKSFLQDFIAKHGGLDDHADNWVDFIYKGENFEINDFLDNNTLSV